MADATESPTFAERALGALAGLAIGDAIGLPAEMHRSVRNPWARAALRRLSADLDEQRVSRPMVPFSNDPAQARPLCPTDDTERAVAAALVMTRSRSTGDLFDSWRNLLSDADAWLGIAERNALRNAARGLRPPTTGTDNPGRHDDSALVPGVVAGLLHPGDPATAARAAGQYAEITHADDGVWAARAAAAATALLAAGRSTDLAVAAAVNEVPTDSWTGRNLRAALRITAEAPNRYDALMGLRDVLDRRIYSFGGVAAETLPFAVAILTVTDSAPPMESILLANSVPRKSDSLPSVVGALSGCASGAMALPASWRGRLDRIEGILIPAIAGTTLSGTAGLLVEHARPRGTGA